MSIYMHHTLPTATSPNSPRVPSSSMNPLTPAKNTFNFPLASTSSEETDDPFSSNHPQFHRQQISTIHQVLYGSRDRNDLARVIREVYDPSATYENAFTFVRGQNAIFSLFLFKGLVPGGVSGELHDIASSIGYDGSRLVVFSHSIHLALLPCLDIPHSSSLHPLHHYYTSAPTTPFPDASPTSRSRTDSGVNDTSPTSAKLPLHFPATAISHLLAQLTPRSIAANLSTIKLKIHTKFIFNEDGKITLHQDTIGIKEIVESIPLVSTVYALNRAGFGYFASFVAKTLFPVTASSALPTEEEEVDSTATRRNNHQIVGAIRLIVDGLKLAGMERDPIEGTEPIDHQELFGSRSAYAWKEEPTTDVATMDES